jgi:hypothetical protein
MEDQQIASEAVDTLARHPLKVRRQFRTQGRILNQE